MRSTARCVILAAVAVSVPVVAGCRPSVDLELARTFQDAQQAFDEASRPEDFLEAAALYQEILDRGIVSGAIFYNQGNAFMQAGARGRAIAAYRRAQRYRPRDPRLQANLDFALAAEGPAAQRRPMIEYLLFWQDWLSYPEKFYLAGAAACVAFSVGLSASFVRRRLLRRLAVGAVAMTLLLLLSVGYDWYRYDHLVHGVVVQEEVIARKGNAASYEPAFTEAIAEGTEFRLVGRRGEWLLIRLAGDQEGWIEQNAAVVY